GEPDPVRHRPGCWQLADQPPGFKVPDVDGAAPTHRHGFPVWSNRQATRARVRTRDDRVELAGRPLPEQDSIPSGNQELSVRTVTDPVDCPLRVLEAPMEASRGNLPEVGGAVLVHRCEVLA